uniref:SOCS box domain-containing protein n=1 Tax=Parascaris univalens TaxID=6257 RepID=A0A915BY33_PARUN
DERKVVFKKVWKRTCGKIDMRNTPKVIKRIRIVRPLSTEFTIAMAHSPPICSCQTLQSTDRLRHLQQSPTESGEFVNLGWWCLFHRGVAFRFPAYNWKD